MTDVIEEPKWMIGGRGPDACIDAVGMEAHGNGLAAAYDATKQAMKISFDRPNVLRQAIRACRIGWDGFNSRSVRRISG